MARGPRTGLMREGDVLDQRFRLEAQAGAGAMGVVFRARDLRGSAGAGVAVKVLQHLGPADVARFEREAELLLALQHPTIVRYVAHGRTPEGEPFLAMEWLDGETLKDRVARQRLTVLEGIDVGLALASALAGAHGRGVVHRDVKPANVFLVGGSTRAVKLLDFGVARLRRGSALTEAGAMMGTPAYMAPEQARGEDEVGARSDVFSLGATLFHAIAGERPFEGSDALDLVLRMQTTRAPPLASKVPAAPAELAALVDAMLSIAAAERPTTEQIFAALSALRASAAPSATMSHVVPVAPRQTIVQRAPTIHGGPATIQGVAPLPPAALPTAALPTSARRARPWLAPVVVVGLLATAAVGVAVAMLVPARGRPTGRASASARQSASARATASQRACSNTLFPVCQRLEFGDMAAVDPDDLEAACLALGKRLDSTAKLTQLSITNTIRGKANLARQDNAFTCSLVCDDGKMISAMAIGDELDARKEPFASVQRPIGAHCPAAKAWSAAASRIGDRPTVLSLVGASTGPTDNFIFTSELEAPVLVAADTCTVMPGF